eukprot:3842496-Amphidinium_carterae.1
MHQSKGNKAAGNPGSLKASQATKFRVCKGSARKGQHATHLLTGNPGQSSKVVMFIAGIPGSF